MDHKIRKSVHAGILLFILLTGQARAQVADSFPSPLRPEDRPINLFLVDIPTNFDDGYYWPTFTQSIHNTVAVHQVVNKTLGRLLEPVHPFWGKVLTGGAILVTTARPSTTTRGTVEAAYERFDAQRYRGYFTTGLAEGLAVDIEAGQHDVDGLVAALVADAAKPGGTAAPDRRDSEAP